MLTDKSLQSIKDLDEHYLWEYASTLFREESVILQIEKAETDPDVITDLASRAIDLANELDSILAILESSIEE